MSYQALGNCDQHWQSNKKNMDSDNVTCSMSGTYVEIVEVSLYNLSTG